MASKYKGALGKPLKPGESAESKLPALLADLGSSTYRDGLVAMLERHVVGKNARDYPVGLRGAPKRGPDAEDRLPHLYQHYQTKPGDDKGALVKMAQRHVPGFSEGDVLAKVGGRPSRLTDVQAAWLREIIDEMIEDSLKEPDRKDDPLTVLECARRISTTAPEPDSVNPFFGIPIKQLVKVYHNSKRDNLTFSRQINRLSQQFSILLETWRR